LTIGGIARSTAKNPPMLFGIDFGNMGRKNKMQKELKCPNCGGTYIVKEDCYDTITSKIGKDNAIKELWCGHCEDCGADLQWEAVYQFIGYDAIEES
jgi:transcription elongation factor Elf1